jgi:hypothetical protein
LFVLTTPPAAVVEMNDKPYQIDPRRIEP